MDNSAIEVFDSGIGDLSIVFELNKLLPNENIKYFAEHPRQSYGPIKKARDRGFCYRNYQLSDLQRYKLKENGCKMSGQAYLSKKLTNFKENDR